MARIFFCFRLGVPHWAREICFYFFGIGRFCIRRAEGLAEGDLRNQVSQQSRQHKAARAVLCARCAGRASAVVGGVAYLVERLPAEQFALRQVVHWEEMEFHSSKLSRAESQAAGDGVGIGGGGYPQRGGVRQEKWRSG